jgi:hypothetical protein
VAAPLLLEVLRPLAAEDLGRLSDAPKVGVPLLQRLRAVHHRQAQLLASGKKVHEVAAIVGCTPQRIVQLQIDPSFAELVDYYRDQQMVLMLQDSARLADKIIDLGEMAVDELRDRFEDDTTRKAIQTGNVLRVAEFAMDRTVAPPKVAAQPIAPPAAITINFGTPVRRESAPTIEAEAEAAVNVQLARPEALRAADDEALLEENT